MYLLRMSLLAVFIAGCATPAQRAAQTEREVDDMIRVYGPGCEKLGYRADSDPWRECVLRLAAKDTVDWRSAATTNCVRSSRGIFQCSTF